MQLRSVQIANYRIIRTATLEFADRVTGIIGPNGAGKSSIVEAMAWALYGNQVARSGKTEIKSTLAAPSDTCRVTLEFAINGSQYTMIRQLVGKSERPEAQLYRGDSLEATGSTDTVKRISMLLGLDWRGFLTSFLARQQELNALSDLAPFKRREHLAGMLGIERLDRAIEQVKGDARIVAQQVAGLERQTAQLDELKQRVSGLAEHAVELHNQLFAAEKTWQKARRELRVAETAFREHEAARRQCSELDGRLAALRKTLEHLREHVARQSDGLSTMSRLQEEMQTLQDQLPALPDLVSRADKYRDLQRTLDHNSGVDAQIGQLLNEQSELATQCEDLARRVSDTNTALAAIDPDLDTNLAATAGSLEGARTRWTDLNAEYKANEQDRSRLRQQLGSMASLGLDSVCDRCLRPFGTDLPAIRKHLEDEAAEADQLAATLTDRLDVARRDGEELKQRRDRLAVQVQQRTEMRLRLAADTRDLTERQQHVARIQKRVTRLTATLIPVDGAAFDAAELVRLEHEIERLQAVQLKVQELRGRTAEIDNARQALAESQVRLQTARDDIAAVSKTRDKLGLDDRAIAAAERAYGTARERADDARNRVTRVSGERDAAERELALLRDQVTSLEAAASDLEAGRQTGHHAEALARLFAEFRSFSISRIRPRLSELAGELLAEMTGNRYSLVELDTDYNLRVMDGGEYYGVERFSGGEKDVANLCLRLAISLALTESAGLDRSFVILDEVFGSQDDNRRELIFEALARLKQRFPQILLITHIDELKHRVERLIEVRPSAGGWSEVLVDGSEA